MRTRIFLMVIVVVFAAACGTFEVGIEPTPYSDNSAQSPAVYTPTVAPALPATSVIQKQVTPLPRIQTATSNSPLPTPVVFPSAIPRPTQTPYYTTPISAGQMEGEWYSITAADGLCTDWPLFIGGYILGTGTTTVCSVYNLGSSIVVPQGTRVTAVNDYSLSSGDWEFATDIGLCKYSQVNNQARWKCQTKDDGLSYTGIRAFARLADESVYMLTDSVAYKGHEYRLPELVSAEDARPTWIDVVPAYAVGDLPEIWIGTNSYGIVVIQPTIGNIKHYTTADGLPGNTIRDVEASTCSTCQYHGVWVATDQGIGQWNGERWTAYTTRDGLPSDDIQGIAVQWDGLWVATTGGAAYFDGISWKSFTSDNGLSISDLTGVKFLGSMIVFGTRGKGLLVFTPKPVNLTLTPQPALETARVIQGTGDFPRLPVVSTASDGKTLALYLVEGSTARQLAILDGTSKNDDSVVCQPAPDIQTFACLILGEGGGTVETIGASTDQRFVLAKGKGKLIPYMKGGPYEQITSIAWKDNLHLLYSKVTWPDNHGLAPKPGDPWLGKSEIWLSNADGKEQQLLATAPVYRILGISPNGQTLYVTYILPVAQEWRMQGFALLDIASGKLENLWPLEPKPFYFSWQLVNWPDGSSRILFVDMKQGPGTTSPSGPVDIRMINPESRQTESIWTVSHYTTYTKGQYLFYLYDSPTDIIWSFQSDKEFMYHAAGKSWRVDLATQKEEQFGAGQTVGKWTSKGIVALAADNGTLQLLDESGNLQGEINLGYVHDWMRLANQ